MSGSASHAREAEDHQNQSGGSDELREQVRRAGAVVSGDLTEWQGEHGVSEQRTGAASRDLEGDIGKCSPPVAGVEGCVHQGNDGVEVGTRHGSEQGNENVENARGCQGVFEELESQLVGRELLGSDSRADHRGRENGTAQKF